VAPPGARGQGDGAAAGQPGLSLFYGWVRRTRAGVLDYAATLPEDDLHALRPAFPRSVAGLLAHAAECYLHWTGHVGLGRAPVPERDRDPDLEGVRALFREADAVVAGALARGSGLDAPLDVDGERLTLRWLVLHPVTHEFHHKGQIASLGRALGHPVPDGSDLDLVLPG